MERALARRERVRVRRIQREQPAAVLQREARALGNQARSEAREDALDQRHHVAVAIDDAQVRGVAAAGRSRPATSQGSHAAGSIGARVARHTPSTAWPSPARHETRGSQTCAAMSAYASFFASISVCSASTRVVAARADREQLEEIEHHQRGDALPVRRQLVDRPSAIRRRERRHPLGVVRGEVVLPSALRRCVASTARCPARCPRDRRHRVRPRRELSIGRVRPQ